MRLTRFRSDARCRSTATAGARASAACSPRARASPPLVSPVTEAPVTDGLLSPSTSSVVFKATLFKEWNSPLLIPWYHYVPVQQSYADV